MLMITIVFVAVLAAGIGMGLYLSWLGRRWRGQ